MFVNHLLAKDTALPPLGPVLYEYVFGCNGIFVRAQRPGLEALIWVAAMAKQVRGLAEVTPYVRLTERVPARLVGRMFEMAYRCSGREILFYLEAGPWRLQLPEQVQGGASVHPVDPFAGGANTLLEVHSHHQMGAFFSGTDNKEEQGFRLYAVIGNLADRPTMLARVGIYGHFWLIPASWVFELPEGVRDGLCEDEDERDY